MVDDIARLESKIEKLPKGYISYKTINGKERHYLQWVENGKLKSKYIPDVAFEGVKADIAYRRELQEKLKRIKTTIRSQYEKEKYKTNVIVGESLYKLAFGALNLESRDAYDKLQTYLHGDIVPRVCILYGLRRTGKTTLMHQAIMNMSPDDFGKTAFIRTEKTKTMVMVEEDLKKLYNHGYKYVFIDEINLLADFVPNIATLADVYCAMGMKIVISGTDSYSLWLLTSDELYDRAYLVHTTWISFSEHNKMFNTQDVDEYICYGGVLRASDTYSTSPDFRDDELSFRSEENAEKYISTSVSKNIQNSLQYFIGTTQFLPYKVSALKELTENGRLADAVSDTIKTFNRKFVLDALTDKFQLSISKKARKNLLQGVNTETSGKISDVDIINRLTQLIRGTVSDIDIRLKEKHIDGIKTCLNALDVTEEFPVKFASDKLRETDNVIFVQPGMRYAYAKELIELLKDDSILENLSEEEKDIICDSILNEIKERMLEDIVLVETKKRLEKRYEVFKYKYAGGEFDMVILDKENYSCRLFEIVHTVDVVDDQLTYLSNKEECDKLESKFGRITGKYVLYLGDTMRLNGNVSAINVFEYLS